MKWLPWCTFPPYFAVQVYEALVPGSTLVVTHREAAPRTRSESDLVVMATHNDEPNEGVAD